MIFNQVVLKNYLNIREILRHNTVLYVSITEVHQNRKRQFCSIKLFWTYYKNQKKIKQD